jgi:HPt (histidine-containing phosphotransfer) domain-containing protein
MRPETGPQDQLQMQLKALADLFAEKLPGKLSELLQCLQSCQEATDLASADEHLATLHRLLHSMAGSAGMFGFDEIGRRARALELQVGALAPGAALDTLADNLHAFFAWAARHVKGEVDAEPTSAVDAPGMVFLLAADTDATRLVVAQLEQCGVELWQMLDLDQFETALFSQTPALVVADLASLPQISESGLTAMVAQAGAQIGLIFVQQATPPLPEHYCRFELDAGADPVVARQQILPELVSRVQMQLHKTGQPSS